MHAFHSLAHRAPPATRARVRWQPYSSISVASCVSIPSRSPPPYLITPSSVSSPQPVIKPPSDHDRIRQSFQPTNSQILKDFPFKDSSRNKYAIGLVDQAVKLLCEIWHHQDMPSAFLCAMVSIGTSKDTHTITTKNKHIEHNYINQLPSSTPSTQASLPSSSVSVLPLPPSTTSAPQDISDDSDSRDNLVPIKGFVHEVLRRSRTSGCVLQTALCYLEAVRPKIPQIAQLEKSGGCQSENSPERIAMATEAELRVELDHDAGSSITWDSIINTEKCTDDDLMATVRVHDSSLDDISNSTGSCLSQDHNAGPKPQLSNAGHSGSTFTSPLPSPLLCPRRAFLASLILASKFMQDKCYSNRAWAKLSGLPPREIGRCERALGEALGWRLWVGKPPVAAHTSPPTVKRPVVRSQSESSFLQSASNRTAFLVWNEKSAPSAGYPSPSRSVGRGGLRRCATLPAEVSTVPISEHTSCGTIPDTFCDHISDQTPSFTSSITPTPSSFTMNSSPNPPTPGLSYSPSSTESSSGDRTIQMSTFLDDSMTSFNSSHRGYPNSAMCPWLDNPDCGKEPSLRMPHHQHVDNMYSETDLVPLQIRNLGEDDLVPCKPKAPPPPSLDPLSNSWLLGNTLLMRPFGPD